MTRADRTYTTSGDAARRELQLRVPEDVSVIGFDDIAMASWPSHELTTVAQPIATMIERLIAEIERLLTSRDLSPRHYFEPGTLVERRSASLTGVTAS